MSQCGPDGRAGRMSIEITHTAAEGTLVAGTHGCSPATTAASTATTRRQGCNEIFRLARKPFSRKASRPHPGDRVDNKVAD
jgi:hypothetical protein